MALFRNQSPRRGHKRIDALRAQRLLYAAAASDIPVVREIRVQTKSYDDAE
jgi:hypothetical protein